MPRRARQRSKSGIYHIILRGINRQTIFEDEEDKEKFLKTLVHYQVAGQSTEDSSCGLKYKLYGYCLMGNHVHMLIKEEEEELGITMRRIGASYVYWYNWKYERTGHLFQDRFKSEAVEDDRYFLAVLRYIHQNPIKAGMVKYAADYPWSSYSEFEGESSNLDTDFVLGLFDNDREKAVEMFKNFHKQIKNDDCLDVDGYKRMKDDEAVEIIKRVCRVSHCQEVQRLEEEKRNQYLSLLKREGLSTRQIARLTGISRVIILKV